MFQLLKKLPRWRKKVSADDYNRLVDRINVLSKIQGVDGTQVYTGPTGVKVRGGGAGGTGQARLYEVQSAATGDAVYNCHEHEIDATDWNSTTEVDKLEEKNTTDVEVWNAISNYIYAPWADSLIANDRMIGWQSTDDEGNKRVAGIPLIPTIVRMAYTQENAPSDQYISCKLADYRGIAAGSAFDVTCIIFNGTALNAAVPRLTSGQVIFIINMWGVWYCVTPFQASEDCGCYSAP